MSTSNKRIVQFITILVTLFFVFSAGNKVYAIYQFNTPASLVLGQPDFTTVLSNRRGVYSYMGFAMSDGKLYTTDYFPNNRILIYNSFPTTNQQIPDSVVGQPSIDTIDAKPLINNWRLNSPQGIAVCNNKLIVGEFTSHRILIWNSIPISPTAPADIVIGQPDFTSNTANNGGVSAHSLYSPRDIVCDGTRLYVVDASNHRVLIWNSIPTTSNQDADVVLGQPNMTSNTYNNGGISAHSIRAPGSVAVYGTKLVVSDTLNQRVLIWNTIPTTNNKDADVVLGQPDFVSSTANNGGITAHGVNNPRGVFITADKLYVADYTNNRVLIWNTVPTSNNANADVVIGQPNMTSNTANNGGLIGSTLTTPLSLYEYNGKLIISDYGNTRALIFNTIPTSNGASADLVLGQPDMQTNYSNASGIIDGRTLYASNLPGGGVTTAGQKLIITDSAVSRVLIFNQIPTQSYASADVVIGQTSLTSMTKNKSTVIAASATTLNQPVSLASDGTKLAIADRANNRVLIYNTIPTTNGASADVAIGQPNKTSSTANNGGRGAATLSAPISVCFAGTKLIVADQANNRILIYNSIPTSDGAAANVVLGQPDMTSGSTNNGGLSASSINMPWSVYCNASKLVVADGNNARVLIWNSIPTVSNTAADVVVGQPDFVSNTPNNGGVSIKSLAVPSAVASDGTRLFISDSGGRLLVFNTFPTTNFANADAIIGQQNFTSNLYNQGTSVGRNTFYDSYGMHVSSDYLYVAERLGNVRVLMYQLSPQNTSASLPATSATTSATLTLAADDAKDMMISTDAGFSGASWESFATGKALTLSSGDGTKTYYVKMRDYANYESQAYTVSTVLDTTAPTGTVAINSGATVTNSPAVSLSVMGTDTTSSVSQMILSESNTFTGASWESFSVTKSFTLSSGDGLKTIYGKVKDAAGNESAVFSASITLDTVTSAPRITQVGKITDIPNKTPLYYYFTSQYAQIKGTSEPYAMIYFNSESGDFSTRATSAGTFLITVTGLPRELVELHYYARDLLGNTSTSKTLKLMIGEENFPSYLLSSTTTPTPTPTPTPTETIEPTSTPTPTPTISVYGFVVTDQSGKSLPNTTVYINGSKYETDKNGRVYLSQKPRDTAIVEIEVNGKKYAGNILGETIMAQTTKTSTNKNSTWVWVTITGLGLIIGLWIILRARKNV